MFKIKRSILAATILFSMVNYSAYADVIPGLYNTGVGASVGSTDPHYSLTTSNAHNQDGTVYTGNTAYIGSNPYSVWITNSSTSNWITPSSSASTSYDPSVKGTYTYEIKFNLAGYNQTTASFNSRLAADNSAVVSLNGNQLGTSNGYTSWSSFSAVGQDFKSGINTLDFTVTNLALRSGNPTGLRVEFLNSNVNPVPEPEEYMMMLLGFGMVGWQVKRKQMKAAPAIA